MILYWMASKQLQIMPIVYILTLLLFTAVSPQCTPAIYSRNLTTQILSFSAANIQNGAYNYTFRTAFSAVPQTALAITQIATASPSALTNSLFYLTASPTTRGVLIILAAPGSNWVVSRVCLWASTNRELLLGSSPMQNLKPTSGSLIPLQFQIQIGSFLPVNSNQVARGFLNGLSCKGVLGSVTISGLAFTLGKITVNVNMEGGQVDTLWISFIVFNLNNGEFAAYGGYTTINSNESQTVDLIKGFSDPQNAFYGINALKSDQSKNGISLQMEIDSSFLLSYTSKMGSFMTSYIFIGYPGNFTCLPCKGLALNYYFNGNCLSQCSYDTISVTLVNGGQLCRSCPAGTGLIAVKGSCVCPDGYAIQNGKCALIAPAPASLSGLKVQYANYQEGTDQSVSGDDPSLNMQSGAINILPAQNINQNLNFISSSQNTPANTVTLTTTATSTTSTNSFVFLPQGAQQPSQSTQSTTTPINPQTAQPSSNINVVYKIASTSCSLPNTFFNGYECVCFVGYIYSNGKCILPQIINIITVATPASFAVNSTSQCPINTYSNGIVCVCVANYYLVNNICTQRPICPTNALDNGLGACICNKGYTMINNVCQAVFTATTCPQNSTLVGSACVCNSGLYNNSGVCSSCPPQAYWSSQTQKCLFVCGVNAVYNQSLGGCACVSGFGRDAFGNCALCANSFYLANGYCVTCPTNSQYNTTTKQCLCRTGFMVTQQGICMQKCGSNEVYNPSTTFCDCIQNFTRIGSVCMPCPTGSYYSNGKCTSCPANSYLLNNKCVCSAGYAADAYGICQICSSLPNAFMLNGLCVKCSNNMVFNVLLNSCECPLGKTRSGNLCISTCNSDELLDRYGNCYTCGLNEIISNGVCVCQAGYTRNSCGFCTISCTGSSFLFMGRCGSCPLNMNYLAAIGGCICPNGYYMDPVSNTCAASNFIMPYCQTNAYYDSNAQKCLNCASNCATCTSSSTCTTCSKGYSLNNGFCQTICGDGVIAGSETCDTGRINVQSGCIQCKVVQGYSCVGQPSICSLIQTTPNNTNPNPPNPSVPRLSLKGNISLNSNNIFLSLLTNPTFTFPNPSVMQNFIQATYVNTLRPVTYCVQEAANLNIFNCLLIYPSGIPNTKFNVLFFFNYQGQMANLTVTIDPLLYASSSRTATPTGTTRSQ